MSFGVIPRNGVSLGIGASPTLAKPPPWASLRLNFAETASLDSSITFTRGTNATYTNSAGNVQLTAGVNDARFDYDPVTLACKGLLIEEARTNLVIYSEQFDNAAWLKLGTATVTANTTTSPDGTLTADTLTLPASADRINLAAVSVAGSTAYILSAWLSGSGTVYLSLATSGGTYKFAGSPITLTSTLTRYTQTITTNSDNTGLFPIIGRYDGSVGAGTATSCVLWGAQLEAGAFATSYIPTTTAAATRNADNAVMTGTNFSSWYNQTQGTLFAQVVYYAELIASAAGTNNIFVDDSSSLNFVAIRTVSNPTSPQADIAVYSGGVPQVDTAGAQPVLANTTYKRAFAFALNNMQAYVNAVADGSTITSALMPVGINRLVIGSGSLTAMWIASISYYPTRLPNATLQALTV